MKAALPDEDLMVLASPAPGRAAPAAPASLAAAAAAAKLPPGSLQLPTTFELLAGGAGVSPAASPKLPPEGGVLAGPLPEEGGLGVPGQPSSVHRSPSVEELLRKVQCVDARQVRGGGAGSQERVGSGARERGGACGARGSRPSWGERAHAGDRRMARPGPLLAGPDGAALYARPADTLSPPERAVMLCLVLPCVSCRLRQVRVLAKIGEGAFGEVSLAECPTYGRVAVKWIKPTKVGGGGAGRLRWRPG